MIFHWILGMLGGALCATLLLVFDPFGIWPLIHDSGSASRRSSCSTSAS